MTKEELSAILRDHVDILEQVDRWEVQYPHVHLRVGEKHDLVLRMVFIFMQAQMKSNPND